MTSIHTNYPVHAVEVDEENPAEIWWSALEEKYPDLYEALRNSKNCGVVLSDAAWEAIEELPGFEDGPEYARTALLDWGDEGDEFCEIVFGRNMYFEVAK